MLDDNFNLKIVDFGYAQNYTKGQKMHDNIVGTDTYMAPELFRNEEYELEKVDVFACGVILFCMHYGMPPYLRKAVRKDPYYKFFAEGRQHVFWKAMKNKMKFEISENFENLINGMLNDNPEERLSID